MVILPSSFGKQYAKEGDWKWDKDRTQNERGMSHVPGIRTKDIDHWILSHEPKPDVVILGQGRGHRHKRDNPSLGILQAVPGLVDHVSAQGIPAFTSSKQPQLSKNTMNLEPKEKNGLLLSFTQRVKILYKLAIYTNKLKN